MRLFVAVEIPEAVRREIDRRAERVRRELPRARWVKSDNLHLTLAFLGDTDESSIPSLEQRLAPAFEACRPFTLRLKDGGSFPPHRSARVAWVGVEGLDGGGEELARLRQRVAEATAAVVGRPERERDQRPFRPHLTLARCSPPWRHDQIETYVRAFRGPLGEPFRVERGMLFESVLGPGGARYRPLESFPLAGKTPP